MQDSLFSHLEEVARRGEPEAVLAELIESLERDQQWPQLFEALLMQARHGLGFPVLDRRSIQEYPDAVRCQFRDRFNEACRTVGSLLLKAGNIPEAWPYFRASGETAPVAEALQSWQASSSPDGDPDLEAVVDVAFQQGVHPVRGYELILAHQGTCDGITVMEGRFPHGRQIRDSCGRLLVRQLYRELVSWIQRQIERAEGQAGKVTRLRTLMEGRPWLFEQRRCGVDDSHLQAVLRIAATLEGREETALAAELATYGCQLAAELQFSEDAPFQNFYEDYSILLEALSGREVERAVAHFTSKVENSQPAADGRHFPAEILVSLLHRVGRSREAIVIFLRYLRKAPVRAAPTLYELSQSAKAFDALLEVSREKEDVLQFTAALVAKVDNT